MLSSVAAAWSRIGSPATRPTRVTVRHGGRYLVLDSRTIRYAVMKDGRVELFSGKLKGTSNARSLDELEGILGAPSFFRTHRAFLVNLDHVVEVVPWFSGRLRLKLDDDRQSEVPVSRARAKVLKKLLKI
jgi:two-component system response regulator LytT